MEKINRITSALSGIEGCSVLGIEPDADYNRTVITLAGEPLAVENAAFLLIQKAIEEIDMSVHKGEHPRLGAVDVCPFIPLRGVSMKQCSEMAHRVAKKYLQTAASRHSSMVKLRYTKINHSCQTSEKNSTKVLKRGCQMA